MAAIDRNDLITDMCFWLPDNNVLSDAMLLKIAGFIITKVGDDDTKYAEILCKSLHAAGLANLSKYTVDGANLKEERIGEHHEKYIESKTADIWKEYLETLKDICPIFGYVPVEFSKAIGIKIHPSDKIEILDCCDNSDLYL